MIPPKFECRKDFITISHSFIICASIIDSGLCVCDPIMRFIWWDVKSVLMHTLFTSLFPLLSSNWFPPKSAKAKTRKFAERWIEKQNNRTRANKRRKRSHNEIWQYHLESMLFGSSTDNTLI